MSVCLPCDEDLAVTQMITGRMISSCEELESCIVVMLGEEYF